MNYITVKQAAEKWGLSPAMVRRYCQNGVISKAISVNGAWAIPENTKKPNARNFGKTKPRELTALAKKLRRQKTKKVYHGLYDHLQIDLTYSSCRMASNRLTRSQVEMIFRKGKIKEMFEPVKVSDLIEVMNHCRCVDYVIDHLDEPISIKMIKQLHHMLCYGTVDAAMGRVAAGEYRTEKSERKETFVGSAGSIGNALKELISKYDAIQSVELEDILDFHVRFERIFPFEDYNGRLGRLIMFKECLCCDVMPFILDDKRRSRYLDGLCHWDNDNSILVEVVNEAQARFERQIAFQEISEHTDCVVSKREVYSN